MKTPEIPPDFRASLKADPQLFERLLPLMNRWQGTYLHWDKIKRLTPPTGFTSRDGWTAIKLSRLGTSSPVPLMDTAGKPFWLGTSDRILEFLHKIDLNADGVITSPADIMNSPSRDQFLVGSLVQ